MCVQLICTPPESGKVPTIKICIRSGNYSDRHIPFFIIVFAPSPLFRSLCSLSLSPSSLSHCSPFQSFGYICHNFAGISWKWVMTYCARILHRTQLDTHTLYCAYDKDKHSHIWHICIANDTANDVPCCTRHTYRGRVWEFVVEFSIQGMTSTSSHDTFANWWILPLHSYFWHQSRYNRSFFNI